MSYNTTYSLIIKPLPDENDPIWKEELDKLSIRYFFYDNHDTSLWGNRVEEMLKLSKKYPDLVFELQGEGEDRDDVWREYYRNGLLYISHLLPARFSEFDENLLEEPE